jgi:hypothetical protein
MLWYSHPVWPFFYVIYQHCFSIDIFRYILSVEHKNFVIKHSVFMCYSCSLQWIQLWFILFLDAVSSFVRAEASLLILSLCQQMNFGLFICKKWLRPLPCRFAHFLHACLLSSYPIITSYQHCATDVLIHDMYQLILKDTTYIGHFWPKH